MRAGSIPSIVRICTPQTKDSMYKLLQTCGWAKGEYAELTTESLYECVGACRKRRPTSFADASDLWPLALGQSLG